MVIPHCAGAQYEITNTHGIYFKAMMEGTHIATCSIFLTDDFLEANQSRILSFLG